MDCIWIVGVNLTFRKVPFTVRDVIMATGLSAIDVWVIPTCYFPASYRRVFDT